MKVNNGFYELAKEYDAVVFFDTETTGLDADGVDELGQQIQVIELAARRLEIANDGTVHITKRAKRKLQKGAGTVCKQQLYLVSRRLTNKPIFKLIWATE